MQPRRDLLPDFDRVFQVIKSGCDSSAGERVNNDESEDDLVEEAGVEDLLAPLRRVDRDEDEDADVEGDADDLLADEGFRRREIAAGLAGCGLESSLSVSSSSSSRSSPSYSFHSSSTFCRLRGLRSSKVAARHSKQ